MNIFNSAKCRVKIKKSIDSCAEVVCQCKTEQGIEKNFECKSSKLHKASSLETQATEKSMLREHNPRRMYETNPFYRQKIKLLFRKKMKALEATVTSAKIPENLEELTLKQVRAIENKKIISKFQKTLDSIFQEEN